jgi:hypothetical protein
MKNRQAEIAREIPAFIERSASDRLLDCERPIGLLAGAGRFPEVFAEKVHSLGLPLVVVGLRDLASPSLARFSRKFYWSGIARLGRIIRCFKREGVREWTMAGKVHKTITNLSWRWLRLVPDWRMLRFWYSFQRRDNRDDSILLHLIDEFAADGMQCVSALDLCPELLVKADVLTQRVPTSSENADIEFGWELAKEMGRLDVGQSVVVKERAVLAVEAIEGTDQAILRAGQLCPRGGFVVVKVAKPMQDMRFDVPTVGVSTIETMKKAGAKVLAIEAGRTILLDAEQTVALANRYGISIAARAAA